MKRIIFTAAVCVAAALGSSQNASACNSLIHQYGMHGAVLPQGGFLIEQVFPYSEAAFDGLLPGDVVLQVNSFQIFAIVHIEGPFSIAVSGPAVAVMTVVRNGQVFVVEAF
jgi:hypothetical protein